MFCKGLVIINTRDRGGGKYNFFSKNFITHPNFVSNFHTPYENIPKFITQHVEVFYVLIVFTTFTNPIKNRFKDKQLTATYNFIALRAIFCKSHRTCDSKVFRISSYFNQLKIKVIIEYGRNFSFIRHFVDFLGGRETTVVFQEIQSVSTSFILKAPSVS